MIGPGNGMRDYDRPRGIPALCKMNDILHDKRKNQFARAWQKFLRAKIFDCGPPERISRLASAPQVEASWFQPGGS
jgi:hypothetical protein